MTDASSTSPARPEHIGFKHPDSAVRDARAHAWLWCMAVLGLTADLWSKAWAFRTLSPTQAKPWISGLLEFQLSLNPGALFGMGSGKGSLFIAASVAALGFVVYLFAGTGRRQRMLHVALGLILAGALGNLYDRATHRYDRALFEGEQVLIGYAETDVPEGVTAIRPWFAPDRVIERPSNTLTEPVRRVGVVRDFLRIVIRVGERSVWPWVFNVADVLLVVGVGLLLIGYWRTPRAPAPVAVTTPEASPLA